MWCVSFPLGAAASRTHEYCATEAISLAAPDTFFSPSTRSGTQQSGADMLIAIVNQSTLVSDQDVATVTQVKLDVAPLWDRSPAAVIFYTDPKNVPVAAHGIAVVDTIKDQPSGVLGYHTEDPGGKLWGVVAAKPELDNGGKGTTGDWRGSSGLSHEVLG